MRQSKRNNGGFTLVELMVASTILLMICGILLSVTQVISKTWTSTTGKVEQFREAREGFESITRRLSQATLNTYWDYERDASNNPTRYIRQSELRFISGPTTTPAAGMLRGQHTVFFQAPLGFVTNSEAANLSNLLNTWGYYTVLTDESSFWPSFISPPADKRFRLMEMSEPSDNLTLYQYTSGTNASGPKNVSYTDKEWYTTPLAIPAYNRVLAKNIIALIILPKFATGERSTNGAVFADNALAPSYTYDSTGTHTVAELNPKNQLPPVIQVTMVAIDENSAKRMNTNTQNTIQSQVAAIFRTVGSTTDPTQRGYARDLKSLEDYLVRNKVNYRVFTTTVSLKSAKWSRAQ